MTYDKDKITEYLNRIGYKGALVCNLETLRGLQYAHVTSIPYENIDLVRKIPVSLDMKDIYEKVVVNKRGGYCFELNGLFAWLLRELGFENVREYAGRFLLNATDIPVRRHRVVVVSAEGHDYICDVGVGVEAPRYPLLYEYGRIQAQGAEEYSLETDDFLGTVVMQRFRGQWQRFYSFTHEPQANIDYAPLSFYCESHPDSLFNKQYMIALKTGDGRYTLDGLSFKIHTPQGAQERKLSEDEVNDCLLTYFNIKL